MKAVGYFVQVKEVGEQGIQTPGNNLKLGEIISIGNDVLNSQIKAGINVLFDTNKSLKHGEYWYLKADSIFAFEEKE